MPAMYLQFQINVCSKFKREVSWEASRGARSHKVQIVCEHLQNETVLQLADSFLALAARGPLCGSGPTPSRLRRCG